MAGPTRVPVGSLFTFKYGTVTLYGFAFQRILLANSFVTPQWQAPRPRLAEARRFRLDSLSLAATNEVAVAFLSCGYWDVSVHRVCLIYLCIQYMIIREPRDQRSFDNFPKIIAVFHALHRHLMPRHPPYALNSLAVIIFTSHSAHCLVGAKNITTRFQFTRPCITALHLNRLPKNKSRSAIPFPKNWYCNLRTLCL